jgi:ABC-type hemin transport system ATPase subunit
MPNKLVEEDLYTILTIKVEGPRARGKSTLLQWIRKQMQASGGKYQYMDNSTSVGHDRKILVRWDAKAP